MAVNGEAVAHVVAAAARVGAHLIHVSTDYVFEGHATTPYAVDHPTDPQSVYGRSKWHGEQQAAVYDRSLVLRTSWLFGPGGPNFVTTMRRLMLAGTPLKVVDDQVGGPTYTPYLARTIWDLADRATTGTLHYQNREPVSWYGFARAIADAVQPAAQIEPVQTDAFPRPAPRPAYSVLDTAALEATVGRRVEPWLAGLTHYLDTMSAPQAMTGSA